jgi:transposase
VYIGVDTHKRSHTMVLLDATGQTVDTLTIANTPEAWLTALTWARALTTTRCWGIENSGSLGKGFAQFLLGQGEGEVREITPHRTAQYRRRGRTQDKTDTADALAMARLLLVEHVDLPTVQRDDASTELRLLSDQRDNLVAERTRLINQLHAQMLQIAPDYKERSGRLTAERGVRYCRDLQLPTAPALVQTRLLIAHQLADQVLRLCADIATLTRELTRRVNALGSPLRQLRGLGPVLIARLLGELGSALRLPSAAALAALAGIAPLTVASGGRSGHRVNRGGNRQLNRVFHLLAWCQRRWEPKAQAYYAKKRAEGKTERAALRCLKRRLVDVVFRLLRPPAQTVVPAEVVLAA